MKMMFKLKLKRMRRKNKKILMIDIGIHHIEMEMEMETMIILTHFGQIDVILNRKFSFGYQVLFFVKNAIFIREIDAFSLVIFCVSHPAVADF